jgi:hypothetical protein
VSRVPHQRDTDCAARALLLDTLAVYEASLRAAFARGVLPDLAPGASIAFHVLAPSTREAPDSSLSHMFDAMLREVGAPHSSHWIADGALDVEGALRDLAAACRSDAPVALCGTAFAFVHLLEALERRGLRFALPPRTRVMETGGFKGRARALPRDELYAWIGDRLGIPATRIVNQYGMTELGSQFYDSVLVDPSPPRRKIARHGRAYGSSIRSPATRWRPASSAASPSSISPTRAASARWRPPTSAARSATASR